jgi:hypothetical protein
VLKLLSVSHHHIQYSKCKFKVNLQNHLIFEGHKNPFEKVQYVYVIQYGVNILVYHTFSVLKAMGLTMDPQLPNRMLMRPQTRYQHNYKKAR